MRTFFQGHHAGRPLMRPILDDIPEVSRVARSNWILARQFDDAPYVIAMALMSLARSGKSNHLWAA